MSGSRAGPALAVGVGVVLGRAIGSEQATFARLPGWSMRRTSSHEQLLAGATRLLGDWFPGAYELAGREAQHTFWGDGAIIRRSMLHQIAPATA